MRNAFSILTLLVLITSTSIAQQDSASTDTVCMPLNDARAFMRANEDATAFKQENALLTTKIGQKDAQIASQAAKIQNFMLAGDKQKENDKLRQEELQALLKTIEQKDKEIKKQKLQKIFIAIGAGVVEALTIYVFVR